MTMLQLAKAIGVSEAGICRWGRGQRIPRVDVAYRIAFALGCDVRDVFPPTLMVRRNRPDKEVPA